MIRKDRNNSRGISDLRRNLLTALERIPEPILGVRLRPRAGWPGINGAMSGHS